MILSSLISSRTGRIAALAITAFALVSTAALAVTLPEMPRLNDGPYAVGFATIERYDYSRTIRPARNYFGEPIPGETARPIQMCIWYPAAPNDSPSGMVFGEFAFPYPADDRFFDFLSALQNRAIGRLHSVLRGNRGLVLDLLSVPTETVYDAPLADGPFPVVVYCGQRDRGIIDNLGLNAYLASHGFIVAAIHSVGATTVTPTASTIDLNTQARDIEFAITLLREFPGADISRLGIVGNGFGGLAGLIVATRYFGVTSLVTLGDLLPTPADQTALSKHPDYAPDRLVIPVLHVSTSGTIDDVTEEIRSLSHSERTIALPAKGRSTVCSYYDVLATLLVDTTSATDVQLLQDYQSTCHYVRAYLAWQLQSDESGALVFGSQSTDGQASPGGFTIVSQEAAPIPPTGDQFLAIIRERGIDVAQEVCRRFDLPTPAEPLLTEREYNEMGYGYLRFGDLPGAVSILNWGTMAYPGSANIWDSYADVCLRSGDSLTALSAWRKSLEALPNDSTTDDNTRTYLRENVPLRISELETGN